MGYIPQDSLDNLKKYSYKGVDKWVEFRDIYCWNHVDNVSRSILSKHVLNPFWTWLVTLWPTSVAPNTVCEPHTHLQKDLKKILLDHAFRTFYSLFQLPHDAILRSHIFDGEGRSDWTSSLDIFHVNWHSRLGTNATCLNLTVMSRWAAGLFLYQSFDAIDGHVFRFFCSQSNSFNIIDWRKQARRTGMAGPLGEMFDHGASVLCLTFLVPSKSRLSRLWCNKYDCTPVFYVCGCSRSRYP